MFNFDIVKISKLEPTKIQQKAPKTDRRMEIQAAADKIKKKGNDKNKSKFRKLKIKSRFAGSF